MWRQHAENAGLTRVQEVGEEADFPNNILANDSTYFNELFSCLTLGSDIGDMVWDLLMKLPTNTHMHNTITELASATSVHWDSLFDPSSPFRLLYSLQIVQTIVYGEASTVCWCGTAVRLSTVSD